jgi:hypothetical protein
MDELMNPRLASAAVDLANGATVDPSGRFRYRLWRTWDANLARACFVMLNPSTADAETDDPTLRRCVAFAASHGFGGIDIVNLFALRSSSPSVLRSAEDAIGPANELALAEAVARCEAAVAAWGVLGKAEWQRYEPLARAELLCLGENLDGSPRHPLYVRGATRLRPWRPISAACRPGGP